jgi:hypothetical protein
MKHAAGSIVFFFLKKNNYKSNRCNSIHTKNLRANKNNRNLPKY